MKQIVNYIPTLIILFFSLLGLNYCYTNFNLELNIQSFTSFYSILSIGFLFSFIFILNNFISNLKNLKNIEK